MATIDAEQQPQPQQQAAVVTETVAMEPTSAVTVAPAPVSVDPAGVAISKRAAKKSKKSKSSNAMQQTDSTSAKKSDKDEEENANNIATVDHPYLSFLHKRIRLYKKKLEKIKSLETAQSEDGKVSDTCANLCALALPLTYTDERVRF